MARVPVLRGILLFIFALGSILQKLRLFSMSIGTRGVSTGTQGLSIGTHHLSTGTRALYIVSLNAHIDREFGYRYS